MIQLESITNFFQMHGRLRKSQRTTLAALVGAVISDPLLGVAKIGRRLALVGHQKAKHAIKRVDRFLGNPRINMAVAQGDLIQTVIGDASEVVLTLDWTDPKDGVHQILALNLRAHGRALPVAWITVRKDGLKDQMRQYEVALCQQVAAFVPVGCHVILLADRGFAAPTLFRALHRLGWSWIIRTKGSVKIGVGGRRRPLYLWARQRPVLVDLPTVQYGSSRSDGIVSCRVVVYCDGKHTDPWYLVVSPDLAQADWPAARIVAAYGQRFTTEECFKDEKNDSDEGFHLDCVTLSTPERWDRLLLVFAWAYYWLNIAGWVAEVAGKDREWRANTVKTKRTHALWRLGKWALAHHDVVWRTMLRAHHTFQKTIPAIVANPSLMETAP